MKKINKIAIFYNNFRGYYLFQKLKNEGYQITKILAKKNLNRKVEKLSRTNKIIKNLQTVSDKVDAMSSNQIINIETTPVNLNLDGTKVGDAMIAYRVGGREFATRNVDNEDEEIG